MSTTDDLLIHSLHESFDRDRFLMVQKRLAINEKYFVSDDHNQPVLFIERKQHLLQQLLALLATVAVIIGCFAVLIPVMITNQIEESIKVLIALPTIVFAAFAAVFVFMLVRPKRHVQFYRDDTRKETLLSINQDNRIQVFFAHYTVLDESGAPIARLRKNQFTNLLRKRWVCKHLDGQPMCVAMEDSLAYAILRRLFGTMMGALRTNYILLAGDGTQEKLLGKFDRQFTLFDKYVLDMTADPGRELDRRVALAIGVLLDTGERR
jgi:hypothetical protein